MEINWFLYDWFIGCKWCRNCIPTNKQPLCWPDSTFSHYFDLLLGYNFELLLWKISHISGAIPAMEPCRPGLATWIYKRTPLKDFPGNFEKFFRIVSLKITSEQLSCHPDAYCRKQTSVGTFWDRSQPQTNFLGSYKKKRKKVKLT